MNTMPTNLKYPEQIRQDVNHEAYLAPAQAPVQYYASPAHNVQYVMYVPQTGVAQPAMYPAMHQMGAIPPQAVPIQPLMAPIPEAPAPQAQAPATLNDRKSRAGLLVLGIITLLVSVFFFAYTPLASNSKSHYCYSSCYSNSCSDYCYRDYRSYEIFNGFGWTSAATFLIQSSFLLGMFAAKNATGLRAMLIISMVIFAIFAVVELSASVTTGTVMHHLYWDAMASHIVALIISLVSFVLTVVVYKKLFASGALSAQTAPKLTRSNLALAGFIISIVILFIGVAGFVVTAVFMAWMFSTVAALMYIACGAVGAAANVAMERNNTKAAILHRINTILGWMLAGTGVICGTFVFMMIYIPWASAIALILAALPAANAILSMIASSKLDKQAAVAAAQVPAPVAETTESEAENVGLVSQEVQV